MIQIECPWCDEPVLIEAPTRASEELTVRCDGCGVSVEIGEPAVRELALAA